MLPILIIKLLLLINSFPNSGYLSLFLVTHGGLFRFSPDKKAKQLAALNMLSPTFKNHPYYRQMKARLLDRKYPNIGDPFKEFTLTDINDSNFNSNSIKNKWILLNFWSNGCGPCVREMDAFVNLYKSIDTSKIAFISIALDENRNKWKNAKATNKIKWTSVWEEDNFSGKLCLNYNVSSMPFFVLFNKEKKIVFLKDGADELENIKNILLAIK